MRKILVHNLNSESSIQMLSISGNTIHFHCSFFADKVKHFCVRQPLLLQRLFLRWIDTMVTWITDIQYLEIFKSRGRFHKSWAHGVKRKAFFYLGENTISWAYSANTWCLIIRKTNALIKGGGGRGEASAPTALYEAVNWINHLFYWEQFAKPDLVTFPPPSLFPHFLSLKKLF
jgi:hypothetical protein